MLEAKHLLKNLGTTPILRGVDVTLREGKITGILSLDKIETRVLFSLLSGHERPASGTISLNGTVLEQRAGGFTRDGIQIIPGTSRLFRKLTILKNFVLGIHNGSLRGGKSAILAQIQPYLRDFGFKHSLETIMDDLTIPDQQLFSLILFLVQDAPVLLFRDLLSNLTLDQYKLFVWKIKELASSGRAIGVVPDTANQLFDFCDDVILLRNGRSIFASPIADIDLEEVLNILNNSEHTIRQSLENKFHGFQTDIVDPEVLYEKGLMMLGNFCGNTQGFILSTDTDGSVKLNLSRYWNGTRPESSEEERLWQESMSGSAIIGTVTMGENRYSWTRLRGDDMGTVLVLCNADEPEFPYQEVIDGLIKTLAALADRLKKEALARQMELHTIRLGKEMDIARNIQASILPRQFLLPGYSIATHLETATEVGGDSYDVLKTRLGNFISIGDVSGHGLPSGIMALIEMAALHGVIQTHLQFSQQPSPYVIYDLVNKVLCEINRDRIGSDKFMTKVLLIENQGDFFHGGTHEVGLLYSRRENQIRELDQMVDQTAFLGISELVDSVNSLGHFHMDEGDFLFLYTDGLIEAKDGNDEQFGIDRVKASLLRDLTRTPSLMLSELRDDLLAFSKDGDCLKHAGHLADDLTMILLLRES